MFLDKPVVCKTQVGSAVTIDEEQNQSFIMECTSSEHRVTLVDVRGNKFQTQKAFNYKNLDAQLQFYLLLLKSAL